LIFVKKCNICDTAALQASYVTFAHPVVWV